MGFTDTINMPLHHAVTMVIDIASLKTETRMISLWVLHVWYGQDMSSICLDPDNHGNPHPSKKKNREREKKITFIYFSAILSISAPFTI